ncbi:MAG: PAS domain S-box protein [Methylococcaceae bacterium]
MTSLIRAFSVIRLLLLSASLNCALIPAYGAEPVRIGVLAFRPKPIIQAHWQPLASALKQAMPEQDFVVEALDYAELTRAVASHQVDFVLSNPGHYLLMAEHSGLSAPLATLATNENGQRAMVFGGVIFTHARQDAINTLADIKGKTIAISDTEAFGGYAMEAYELKQAGINLPHDARLVNIDLPEDEVINEVLAGRTEVGFVRSGVLEHMALEGKLDLNQLKVINRQNLPEFPVLVSTRLYPEWLFAALPNTDENLARHVAAALFMLEENITATQAIDIHGFVVPADYTPVADLLKDLRLPPFDATPAFTLHDIWRRFPEQILGSLLASGLILLLGLRLLFTKRKLETAHYSLLRQQQLLQDSEHKLSAILENVDAHIYLKDTQGHYLYANRSVRELFGASMEQIIGQNDEQFFDAKTVAQLRINDRLVLEQGLTFKSEESNLDIKNGLVSFYLSVKLPLRDEAGNIYALCGISTDITERKRMEEALLESEFLWKFAIEGSGDGVWDWNIQTDAAHYSKRWKEMLGYYDNDILPTNQEWLDRIHPEDQAYVAATMQAYLDGQTEIYVVEYRLRCKDHSYKWILGRGIVVSHSEDGKPLRMIGTHTDITERKHIEAELVESLTFLRTIIENEPECIKIIDAQGNLRQMNPAGLAMIEADSLEQVLNKKMLTVIAPEYRESFIELHTRVLGGEAKQMQFQVIGLKGGRRWLETHAVPMQHKGETVLLSVTLDISKRKQAEEKLQFAASVFSHAREGIMITAADGTILDVNTAFTVITGYEREEVLGKNPRLLHSGQQDKAFYDEMWKDLIEKGYWSGEVWNRRKNGEIYAEMLTTSAVRDEQGNTRHYVALFSDITSIKAHEHQLERIAHFDMLTSLPNRVLLADRLRQAMTQVERREQRLAAAFIDLDGFKTINDKHGHDVGDQLLITVAARMKQALRVGDTLARLGGDEFVAVLPDLADVEASVPMLSRLLEAASQPVNVGELALQVSASLGVTFYPQVEDIDADQLLRQADQAMYQAKQAGKNRYHVFNAEQSRSLRGHHESLQHIRRALALQEFVLHYQPKVNMRTGTIIGAEALIRWQHPEKGLLPPSAFLPVIEDHPLSIDIGDWVIASALTQIELWHADGLNIPVSINVGARQLQQANFVERLQQQLNAHPKVGPGDLEIEVLETSALEDVGQVSQIINACREMGIMFALDDFGTGYSSLTYLKRLPVKQLKVDQSFVRDMLSDPDDLSIIKGVVSLARAFRREVLAEGVESIEHGSLLLLLGCELAQGYGIARPMPACELPNWASVWRPDPAWACQPSPSDDDLTTPHTCDWLAADGLGQDEQSGFEALERLLRQIKSLATELSELNPNPEALAKLDELHSLQDEMFKQLGNSQ